MPDLRGLNDGQLEKQIAGNTGHLHDAAVHERQRRQMERLVTSAVNQLSQPNAWTQLGRVDCNCDYAVRRNSGLASHTRLVFCTSICAPVIIY